MKLDLRAVARTMKVGLPAVARTMKVGLPAVARTMKVGLPAVARSAKAGARRREGVVADPFVIETIDLRKTYEIVEALRGLNLQVPAGSICGFLGRNGAGKTTTIKVLLGMTRPTGGQARVFGLSADAQESSVEIRRRTGFVSEEKDLYDFMTVEDMIRFTAAFFPRWRADLEQR